MSTYIGIDPGQTGAIAFLRHKEVIAIHPMPVKAYNAGSLEMDAEAIAAILKGYGKVELATIEQVSATPKFGSKSSFTFGKGFGYLLAILELLKLPHLRVQPKEWKKTILVGTDQSKEAAIGYVKRLHPGVRLIRPGEKTDSHDFAEAVCLAKYGERYGK